MLADGERNEDTKGITGIVHFNATNPILMSYRVSN